MISTLVPPVFRVLMNTKLREKDAIIVIDALLTCGQLLLRLVCKVPARFLPRHCFDLSLGLFSSPPEEGLYRRKKNRGGKNYVNLRLKVPLPKSMGARVLPASLALCRRQHIKIEDTLRESANSPSPKDKGWKSS
jgi:hypothetical protein